MSFGCVVCRKDIPIERQRKGSHFCSKDCALEYNRLRRAQLAERKCRYCGRRKRRQGNVLVKVDKALEGLWRNQPEGLGGLEQLAESTKRVEAVEFS